MTISEKLFLMESMERRNKERAACIKPAAVHGEWRKTCKYGNTYEVRVAHEDFEELHRRGCTHADMVGWSVQDALKKLNERLALWNIQITSLEKSILSE